MTAAPSKYGVVNPARVDVRGRECETLDLRVITGGDPASLDETRTWGPGEHPFVLSVFGPAHPGAVPVAEVLCMIGGVEVSIVGHLTGRPGVREITPDLVAAARQDPDGYRRQLAGWLGLP